MSYSPFPFVAVSGRPYERGLQYGRAAAGRVLRSIGIYGNQLDQLHLRPSLREALLVKFEKAIAEFDESYLEEMRGIADGAGASLESVIMINARTEMVAEARVLMEHPQEEEDDDEGQANGMGVEGCTGAIVLPERTVAGNLLQGQNWDWRPECVETAVVLCVRRDDGPDVLTFVEAGGLGRHGMNTAGIAVTGNYLRSDRDYQHQGVPLALVRRKALDQEHFALAIRAVAATPKACATNMMLSHVSGCAINFECGPDEAFSVFPEDGIVVHANHFASPIALLKLRDTGIGTSPDSQYRDRRLRHLLNEPRRQLTREDVKTALFDDFLSPYSICRPPRSNNRGDPTASVAMIVMEPALGVMEVAPMPALNRRFTRYSFGEEPFAVDFA